MLYQSSLERKNFVKLKETHFCSVIKLTKPFSVPKAKKIIQKNEKLREVSVSSFFDLIIMLLLRRYLQWTRDPMDPILDAEPAQGESRG